MVSCPICQEKFRKNDDFQTHFNKVHLQDYLEKLKMSGIIIGVFFILSLIVNNLIVVSEVDSSDKITNIDLRETVILSDIYFSYWEGKGQLKFDFFDEAENLSRFEVQVPDGLRIVDYNFSVEENAHSNLDDVLCEETRHERSSYFYTTYGFLRKNNTFFPNAKEVKVTIDLEGDLQPLGQFYFIKTSNTEKSADYLFSMKFANRECTADCYSILTGTYGSLITRQEGDYLIIESNKHDKNGDKQGIRFYLSTKNKFIDFKGIYNIFMPIIVGLLITVIFSGDLFKVQLQELSHKK